MKKSIVITALFSVLGLGTLFANAAPAKTNGNDIDKAVVINGLTSKMVVTVSVTDNLEKEPMVQINDSEGNNLFKKAISSKTGETKAFNISNLELGDYTLIVTTGKQSIEKQVRVLDLDGKKSYFIFE
ncbi:hypothetical protein INP83_10690 [Mucilaginibacter sp. 21P]|uniref:hypothetical protein n=1 Tax=Mucilaginibacter sp. 21P TaxID=2778902 RepID=UPI001C5728AA|nr:hypothetical protein [Mucilaginibacter sp. 21P]QXV67521.1 hypothetical protein INP83_10690 [Mucilaginibacter sp. 21P]